MTKKYDAVVLFSGGLDSILSAKLLENQGLKVLCLHLISPFFGNGNKVPAWRDIYQLDIEVEDASDAFVSMLAQYPPSGTGKILNPCVDCKITLLKLAKKIMPVCGAQFIATGEVLGQRPMSQRLDTLNAISRDSGCAGILLRPLCARLLPPTPMEEAGLVNRARLLRISGRGRNEQLALSSAMGIAKIPAPGGGCRLTEMEAARRYWPLLRSHWQNCGEQDTAELVADFWMANLGRVLFHAETNHMLCIGRNERDNARLTDRKGASDIIIRLPFPGPLGLARKGRLWDRGELEGAAAVVASYAPRARTMGEIVMRLINGDQRPLTVAPAKQENIWRLPTWVQTHEEIRICRKDKMADLAKGEMPQRQE